MTMPSFGLTTDPLRSLEDELERSITGHQGTILRAIRLAPRDPWYWGVVERQALLSLQVGARLIELRRWRLA